MKTGRPKLPIMLSDQEQEQLTSMVRSRSLPHGLVTRAHIVLLAAQGTANREIAERLFISVGTVKTHVHNIYGKLGVSDRPKAIARTTELNLI